MASRGEQFIITYEVLKYLIISMFGILILGFLCGFEIGRYYEVRFGGIWAKFVKEHLKKDC